MVNVIKFKFIFWNSWVILIVNYNMDSLKSKKVIII